MKAFPITIDTGLSVKYEQGMDLRDYFAAKAMQAYLTTSSGSTATNEMIAFESYKTADEMMKARDL